MGRTGIDARTELMVMESSITFWQAIALAAVQGITEFVPVSSSGHLVLARTFLGWSDHGGLVFDTVLHGGSLAALLIYFRGDIAAICGGLLASIRSRADPRRTEFLLLAVATMPAVVIGPFLKPLVETEAVRNNLITGLCMIVTALLFFASDLRRGARKKELNFKRALVIGFAQVVAMMPGASRSGWTIGAGVLCGQTRESSVRFSFLMAIPVIAGAIVFQMKDIFDMASLEIAPSLILWGLLASFMVSLGAIHFCVSFFRAHRFRPFAVYMAAVGMLAIIFR